MIEVIVRIVSAAIVSDPTIILSVNVRCRRMSGLILVGAPLLRLLGRMLRRLGGWSSGGRRTVLRNVPAANSLLVSAMLLRLGRMCWLRLMLFRLASLLAALAAPLLGQ
jgi:hypothetical protein